MLGQSDGRLHVRVSDLFKLDNLPKISEEEGIIYCCLNLINDKAYIGKSKYSIQGRWILNGLFSHYQGYLLKAPQLLYRALNKYGPENFVVFLLDQCHADLLNEKEKYWIKELHTCIYDPLCHGYNMTWGGNDCAQLHTSESRLRAVETNKANHGGVMAFNMPTVIAAKVAKYGSVTGYLNTPEVQQRSYNTRLLQGNGDPCYMLRTPTAIKRRCESDRLNHGGVLAFNTKESYNKSVETKIKIYGDPMEPLFRKTSRLDASKTRILNSIDKKFDSLRSVGLDITAENIFYYRKTSDTHRFIRRILYYLDDLRESPRWTPLMESVFSRYDLSDDKIIIK